MPDWFTRKPDGTLDAPLDWKGWAMLGALILVDVTAIGTVIVSLFVARIDPWMLAVWIVFVGVSAISWLVLKRAHPLQSLFSKAKR